MQAAIKKTEGQIVVKQSYKVTYISNAGVIIEFQDKKIMIDGLCSSKIPIYKSTPPEVLEKLILNIPPFNDIDVLLFTHYHGDHFDPVSTAEFLKNNTRAVVISTCKVIEKIESEFRYLDNNRFLTANPALYSAEDITAGGISIKAYSMLHEGEQYRDVQNLAYLVDAYGIKVLHVGDAKPVEENFINFNLSEKSIDLLIAPFPYVSIIKGRQVIEKYIKPGKIIAVHLPYKELDDFNWIDSAKKSYLRVKDNFTETVFFENIGCDLSEGGI